MEWGIAVAVLGGALALLLYEPIGGRWLVYWHGQGEAHQYQFYRCYVCRRVVTHRHIVTGGCPCQGSVKISPAKLSARDKARLIYLPWTVTSPMVRRESARRQRAIETLAMLRRIEEAK